MLYDWLLRVGTWRTAGLLAAACAVVAAVFHWRERALARGAKADPGRLPDGRLWYTPAEVWQYFDRLGPDGRRLYAVTTATLDVAFPILYAMLLGVVIARLCPPGLARWAVWLPVAAAVADLGENAVLVWLAWTFDGKPSALAWAGAACTATKWG